MPITAATAAGDLADNKQGVTNVVAIADLKLDVSDPSGPIAVGQEAVYEIRVTNRGASAAEEVNVVGLFSAGLEPETGEGAPYTVSDGRVAFRTINKLPAGQDIVLQIRAKATEAGHPRVPRRSALPRPGDQARRRRDDAVLRGRSLARQAGRRHHGRGRLQVTKLPHTSAGGRTQSSPTAVDC